jgi:hypothetical protein
MILSAYASHPLARSYVVKLHVGLGARRGRIVGRLSHVVTGRQFRFTSADELIALLIECDSADRRKEGEP